MSTDKKKEKKRPSFQDQVLSKLRACTPDEDSEGMYEIARSTTTILSKIKYVLTTGIASFDDVVGGMPFGRLVEVFGVESCGKTALSVTCAARASLGFIHEVTHNPDGSLTYRQLDPDEFEITVLYIDNEGSLDEDQKIVVNGKQLDILVARCDTIDMMFKMIDKSIMVAETRKAEAGNKKLQFFVAIVDTIAATSSKQEIKQAWGAQDYARQPQQLSSGFRKLVRRIGRSNTCVICTNQVRQNMKPQQQSKGRGGNTVNSWDFNSFGGMALRFYASHRVFMQPLPTPYKLSPNSRFPDGLVVQFRTVKNRLRMPLRDGRMALLFSPENGGLNDLYSMLEHLVYYECAEKSERGSSIKLLFNSHGVALTTFDPQETQPSLAEQDDDEAARAPKRKVAVKDPVISCRADWPAFYAAHKEDVDKLWEVAVAKAFSTGIGPAVELDEDGDPIVTEETTDSAE